MAVTMCFNQLNLADCYNIIFELFFLIIFLILWETKILKRIDTRIMIFWFDIYIFKRKKLVHNIVWIFIKYYTSDLCEHRVYQSQLRKMNCSWMLSQLMTILHNLRVHLINILIIYLIFSVILEFQYITWNMFFFIYFTLNCVLKLIIYLHSY